MAKEEKTKKKGLWLVAAVRNTEEIFFFLFHAATEN
jgi:hypothetical protein